METLEEILREVERLRCDLIAEIVVQEERGHDEDEYPSHWSRDRDGDCPPVIGTTYVIDRPRITKPNDEKRETARRILQEIHSSSEWFCVRFATEFSLGVDPKVLSNQLDNWLNNLNKEISISKEKAKLDLDGVYHFLESKLIYMREHSIGGSIPVSDNVLKIIYLQGKSPIAIDRAGDDLGWRIFDINLSELSTFGEVAIKRFKSDLKRSYESACNPEYRKKAGEKLGYSPLRIWAHEHPVAATVSGLAATGVTSGLGYVIYEYLSM